jgi:hypothetical protein
MVQFKSDPVAHKDDPLTYARQQSTHNEATLDGEVAMMYSGIV